jgi:hypothetical protein
MKDAVAGSEKNMKATVAGSEAKLSALIAKSAEEVDAKSTKENAKLAVENAKSAMEMKALTACLVAIKERLDVRGTSAGDGTGVKGSSPARISAGSSSATPASSDGAGLQAQREESHTRLDTMEAKVQEGNKRVEAQREETHARLDTMEAKMQESRAKMETKMQEGTDRLEAKMSKIEASNAVTQAAMASALSAILERLDKSPSQSGQATADNDMVKVVQYVERMVPASQVGSMGTAAPIEPQGSDTEGFGFNDLEAEGGGSARPAVTTDADADAAAGFGFGDETTGTGTNVRCCVGLCQQCSVVCGLTVYACTPSLAWGELQLIHEAAQRCHALPVLSIYFSLSRSSPLL